MKPTLEEVKEKVIGIVADELGFDKGDINDDSRFMEDLEADSLDSTEIIMEFETEFRILISDEDAKKITTIGIAVEKIHELLPDI